jgi:hypothetical protein
MAIKKGNIIQNINELETLFTKSLSRKREFFYAKLAVLEACGWIEETMDEIMKDYYVHKLLNVSNQNEMKGVVKRTFGFGYDNNFRKMIIYIVGLINTEKIEVVLDNRGILLNLKARLDTLKHYRDEFAHTHTRKGVIPNYPHPTTIKNEINIIFSCLKSYQKELRKIK